MEGEGVPGGERAIGLADGPGLVLGSREGADARQPLIDAGHQGAPEGGKVGRAATKTKVFQSESAARQTRADSRAGFSKKEVTP